MLAKSLGQMNEQNKPGKKGGKGKKSKGFQLPDIIKKQESLNEAMKQMLEAGEKKPGDKGKEEDGGKKKPGDKGKSGEEGKKGKEGDKGEEGEKGKDGKSGKQGESGENGQQGQNGKQGQGEGESGQGNSDGKGKNGKDGKSGEGEKKGNKEDSSDGSKGENGKDSKNGKGDKKGEGNGSGNGEGEPNEEESDYGELFEIYKQQQDLRNQLQNRLEQDGIKPNEKRILSQMEQVENELLERGFNEETMKRMINLKHQLFKLDKAQFQQGEDNKRKGDTNKKDVQSDQLITPEQIKQYFNTTEILNRQVLPLQPEFKRKVQEYFIDND